MARYHHGRCAGAPHSPAPPASPRSPSPAGSPAHHLRRGQGVLRGGGRGDEIRGRGLRSGGGMAGRLLSLTFLPDIRTRCTGAPGGGLGSLWSPCVGPLEESGDPGWAALPGGGCLQGSGAGTPPTTAPRSTACLKWRQNSARLPLQASNCWAWLGHQSLPLVPSLPDSAPWEEGDANGHCPFHQFRACLQINERLERREQLQVDSSL